MTTLAAIYERLGGEQGFRSIVDDFYQRVLADPALSPFFSGVNIAALKEHQAAFLIQALGGPNHYKGRDMEIAHAGLKIKGKDFYAVADHLVNALTARGVDEDTIGEVVDRIEPLSRQIVNQPD